MSVADKTPWRVSAMPPRPLDFGSALSRLSAAAEQSQIVLFAEATIVLRQLLAAEAVQIIVHSGGVWRRWERLDDSDDSDDSDGEAADLPSISTSWDGIVELADALFVPVRVGSVALILRRVDLRSKSPDSIDTAATLLRLALAACAGTHGSPDKLEAIRAFQRVAGRILKSQDLQEVLLCITHEAKIRLGADISGVMLLEGTELAMQRCVGNLSIDTANLRMRQGQGVGGRVLATREPCSVEDYLCSDLISRDFFGLARSERVRSALAAPILSKDEVIGVLEVWRRRPSTFTCQHTAELVTLANLAAIAIENIGLANARDEIVRELAQTNRALQGRYEAIQRSASLQQGLTRALLQGEELPGIAAQAAEKLGAPVVLLDMQLDVTAAFPHDAGTTGQHRRIRSLLRRSVCVVESHLTACRDGNDVVVFQPIMAGADHLGWVVVVCREEPDESLQLAIAQVCTMAALCNVKQRAAARARSDKLAAVVWDLLEGPENVRRLALERARDLDIALTGDLAAMCVSLGGLDGDGASAQEIEGRRRMIGDAPMRIAGASAFVLLAALRGDTIGVVCQHPDAAALESFATSLVKDLVERLPQLAIHAGISTPAPDPMALSRAYREAGFAAATARRRGRPGVLSYGAIGIAGLLMGARDEADFRQFVTGTLGAILREKPPHREALLNTLRVFFAHDCNRKAAAEQLRVHQKTISYRLDKIARLTGLELSHHEHRIRTDLALRIHEILRGGGSEPARAQLTGPV